MGRIQRYASLLLLAACIAAAFIFKRFVFVAWYPVVMSAAFAAAFGLSLFSTPLCLIFAREIPPGILPEDAEPYCRKWTMIWCGILSFNTLAAVGTVFAPRIVWFAWNGAAAYLMMGLVFFIEARVRRRHFAVTFHTSGSTARPKTIVKTFESLAREVAYHRSVLASVLAVPSDRRPLFLATIEPGHMYGILWRVLLPRAAGCAVDPEVILTPESLLAKMRAASHVFLVTTPSFLERFAAYADQYDVPQNVVEIVTSGALLTAEVSAAAKRIFGVAPREIFGSTETGGVAWRRQDAVRADAFDWTVFDPVAVSRTSDGRLRVSSPFSCEKNFVMGDGVELASDGRRFKLFGRMDRLVKINEQRVSLPEMEEKIRALPDVRDAALCTLDGPHGPVLGAVIVLVTPPPDGKRALALSLRSRLLPLFPKGTAPKRYRFVCELPKNPQGKLVSSALREIFESNLIEPFVGNDVRTANAFAADFIFDRDAPYFEGHFPGLPVLPGVIQLGMAHHFAELFTRHPLTLKTVKKMKFSGVIVPGVSVRFTLTKKSETEFAYEYRKGECLCSSGILCC